MKTASPPAATPPRPPAFSRPLDVDGVPARGLALVVEPAATDCPVIAAACGLPALASLRVSYEVMPRAGGRYEVTGDLTARVTQICVVSLEPFESDVAQAIDLTFAPGSGTPGDWFEVDVPRRGRRDEAERGGRRAREAPPPAPISEDGTDPPDPIIDGRIDLGAIALEFLVLALDPYPKKPGVAFDGAVVGDAAPEPSAFAGLARLKDRT